jgi:hypothetical protein
MQMEYLRPAVLLATGFEMLAYREKLVDSLHDNEMPLIEAERIASDYDLALDIFTLTFPDVPQ